ncbi:hypothetical protein MHB43_01495 [Paenibacillus sp. FSL H8-0317]|nr:hypothetical protein [Paenibacillus xylanexedens]MBY0117800.1 hypothetical protein [Paenibacillus xylanexedens]
MMRSVGPYVMKQAVCSSSDVYQYWLTLRGLGENTGLQSRKYLLTT